MGGYVFIGALYLYALGLKPLLTSQPYHATQHRAL